MQDTLQTTPSVVGSQGSGPWSIEYVNGKAVFREAGAPVFTIGARTETQLNAFLRKDAYSAATAFVRGDLDVEGDIISAIRWQASQRHSQLKEFSTTLAEKLARTWFSLKSNVAGNQFYRTFLDSRMVYSCGYFRKPTDSLEEAQKAKLDHICRKLGVEPGERFLDIGCGWGGLLFHAAESYGATCTGCTLSHSQIEFVREKLANSESREHVGRRRLQSYFTHIAGTLVDNGLFLNHAIARPATVKDGAETLFLQRNVFPGGDLLPVSQVIRAAAEAGFEVLDLENLRPHYALTCRAWVNRLQAGAEECLRTVARDVYRTWLLYLAGCAVSFEAGHTEIYQALFAKRSPNQQRALTREYMYCR